MSTGETLFATGSEMSPYFNGVIKSCATGIMPPAVVLGPAVQALATSVYMNQCNPGDLMKAAGAWMTLAERNQAAAEALEAEVAEVNDDNWSGDDAEAFKAKAADFQAQLRELALNACLLAAELIVLAVTLAAYWAFLLSCTIAMDAYLVAYLSALATGVGAPAAAGIQASANATAATMVGYAKTTEGIISTISHTCAALCGAFTVFTFAFQKSKGNPASPLDIAGAGIVNMLEGLATYYARKFTMTPAGRHANTAWWQHGVQSATNVFPTYQGGDFFDPDNWNGGFDGGGAGLGLPDGIANAVGPHLPEGAVNPEDPQWT
ncbi:hypothetical protein [Glycomyces paridis]|uniref:PPE domain-containing protein n=1 Tax=Glycomyces paridis TaxID=2126555 RepID=A0A4S8PP59_9ACTN|nr:hypothetical protein [Glycomyces paridis]THV30114.1 hypothetical protein E9998_06970 [Glycomyces paridis]